MFQVLIGILTIPFWIWLNICISAVSSPYRYSNNFLSCIFQFLFLFVSSPYRYSNNMNNARWLINQITKFQVLIGILTINTSGCRTTGKKWFQVLIGILTIPNQCVISCWGITVSSPYRYSNNERNTELYHCIWNVSSPYRYSNNWKDSLCLETVLKVSSPYRYSNNNTLLYSSTQIYSGFKSL